MIDPLLRLIRPSAIWLRTASGILAFILFVGAALPSPPPARFSGNALAAALRKGGFVIVIRHANSPSTVPDKQTADSENAKLERQLDAAGREAAIALGKGLRDLKIPVGEVFTSAAYRTIETARLAQLPSPKVLEDLGESGQSMQTATAAQVNWLRERVQHLPGTGTNTILVTHSPNLAGAFPDWGTQVDSGESVVLGLDSKGATEVVGRIKPEEWAKLR